MRDPGHERSRALGVALSVLALGVAAGLPSGAPGYHRGAGEGRWLEAVANARPLDGSTARGLVQISSHKDGPTRIRGVVKGLLIPAVQMVRVAVGDLSCDELGSGDDTSDLTFVGDWRPVAENGTAYFKERDAQVPGLRGAESLAIVGDFTGDDVQDIVLACGPPGFWVVDNEVSDTGKRVFSSAASLRGAAKAPRFLASAEYFNRAFLKAKNRSGTSQWLSMAAINLEPDSAYRLAGSPKRCSVLGTPGTPVVLTGLKRFKTGGNGSAFVNTRLDDQAATPLRRAKSLVIATRTQPSTIEACARIIDNLIHDRIR